MSFRRLITIMMLVASVDSYAIIRFPAGTFVLDGKILIHNKRAFLAVNFGSDAETRIKLLGNLPDSLFTQSGSNASIKLRVKKPFISVIGQGEFVEVKRYLTPFEVPTIYNDGRSLPTE